MVGLVRRSVVCFVAASCVLVGGVGVGSAASVVPRVTSGSGVVPAEAGFVAFVRAGGVACGGTFVRPDVVVTAAHCLVWPSGGQVEPEAVFVGAAGPSSSRPLNFVGVSDFWVHPEFSFDDLGFDLAVLRLSRPVPGVSPVAVLGGALSDLVSEGDDLRVLGWGRISSGGEVSDFLLGGDVVLFPQESCSGDVRFELGGRFFAPFGDAIDSESTLCAAGVRPDGEIVDACQGDSGGPLVARRDEGFVLVGVVSAGVGCGGSIDGIPLNRVFPGIYSDVLASSDWLVSVGVPVGEFISLAPAVKSDFLGVVAGVAQVRVSGRGLDGVRLTGSASSGASSCVLSWVGDGVFGCGLKVAAGVSYSLSLDPGFGVVSVGGFTVAGDGVVAPVISSWSVSGFSSASFRVRYAGEGGVRVRCWDRTGGWSPRVSAVVASGDVAKVKLRRGVEWWCAAVAGLGESQVVSKRVVVRAA